MVAPWRIEMIRAALAQMVARQAERKTADYLDICSLDRLINDPNFDEPTAADENETEANAAVAGCDQEFVFKVSWYMGEEWIEATGKSNCAVDALGELCGAIEEAKMKELNRQRIADERERTALEVLP